MFFSTSNLFDSDMILTVRTANPSKRIITTTWEVDFSTASRVNERQQVGGISVIGLVWHFGGLVLYVYEAV